MLTITVEQRAEVSKLALSLANNYTWDKYCQLTDLCIIYDIDMYETENGFGIEDEQFQYSEN